jgi:hypothetical protein
MNLTRDIGLLAMKKILTLLFVFLLALGCMAGYIYLNNQIAAGSLKVAAGQKELEEGEHKLSKGKAELSAGEQKLSLVKSGYKGVKSSSLLWITALPVAGEVFAVASNKLVSNKIAQENQLVSRGKNKVKDGEEQLHIGKLELHHGIELLDLAKVLRFICVIGVISFSFLLIILGFYWRCSLCKVFRGS